MIRKVFFLLDIHIRVGAIVDSPQPDTILVSFYCNLHVVCVDQLLSTLNMYTTLGINTYAN